MYTENKTVNVGKAIEEPSRIQGIMVRLNCVNTQLSGLTDRIGAKNDNMLGAEQKIDDETGPNKSPDSLISLIEHALATQEALIVELDRQIRRYETL